MRCPKCGAEIKNEDNRFCTSCGCDLRKESSGRNIQKAGIQEESAQKESTQKKGTQKEAAARKDRSSEDVRPKDTFKDKQVYHRPIYYKNRAAVAAIAVAAAVLAVIFIVNALPSKTIKLDRYVEISFEGYDTLGRATATFDVEGFEKDYGKKLKKESDSDISAAVSEFLDACVDGKLSKQDSLSNGDMVEYAWSCDESKAQSEYGYKLKYSNIQKKVKGLKSVGSFDPFDGIEVVFEGVGPLGQAYITGKPADRAVKNLTYDISKYECLSDGDVVTVTVRADTDNPTEYFAETYGKLPTRMSQDYTVTGLGKYVESASEISNAALKELRNDAEDKYRDSHSDSDYTKFLSLEYLGNYFLNKTADGSSEEDNNTIYLVYREKARLTYEHPFSGDPYDKIHTFYWYIEYHNLIIDSEGELTFSQKDYRTPSHQVTVDPKIRLIAGSAKWHFDGYETLDEFYSDITAEKSGSYSIEDNISDAPLLVE